jgi:hypothetical protein
MIMGEWKEKPKRARKKKRTKAQEEKRAVLLDRILNKWVCVKQNDGMDENYVFMKHRVQEGGSFSKLEQILLSGDSLCDGVYLITDYDIDIVIDSRTSREIVEIKPKKYDLKVGVYAEDVVVSNLNGLREHLVQKNFLTEEEFSCYCQSDNLPKGTEVIIMSYDSVVEEEGWE